LVTNGRIYTVPQDRTNPEERARFEALTPQEKADFFANRELILGWVASGLNRLHLPAGFVWRQADWFSRWRKGEAHPAVEPTNRERGVVSVQAALEAFDQGIWQAAPQVARITEFAGGVNVGGSLGIIGGVPGRSYGFMPVVCLSLSLGYDHKQKAVVLELRNDFLWANGAQGLAAGISAHALGVGSGSGYDWNEPLDIERGTAISVPFLSASTTDRNVRVAGGADVGFGFGLAKIDFDLYSLPLVRVGFSPNWKGLVRAKVLSGPVIRGVVHTARALTRPVCRFGRLAIDVLNTPIF
jgi:hypothetical protein